MREELGFIVGAAHAHREYFVAPPNERAPTRSYICGMLPVASQASLERMVRLLPPARSRKCERYPTAHMCGI